MRAGRGCSAQSVQMDVSLKCAKCQQVSQASVGKEITIRKVRLGISSIQVLYILQMFYFSSEGALKAIVPYDYPQPTF